MLIGDLAGKHTTNSPEIFAMKHALLKSLAALGLLVGSAAFATPVIYTINTQTSSAGTGQFAAFGAGSAVTVKITEDLSAVTSFSSGDQQTIYRSVGGLAQSGGTLPEAFNVAVTIGGVTYTSTADELAFDMNERLTSSGPDQQPNTGDPSVTELAEDTIGGGEYLHLDMNLTDFSDANAFHPDGSLPLSPQFLAANFTLENTVTGAQSTLLLQSFHPTLTQTGASVPEPFTASLLGLGLFGAAFRRRFKTA